MYLFCGLKNNKLLRKATLQKSLKNRNFSLGWISFANQIIYFSYPTLNLTQKRILALP